MFKEHNMNKKIAHPIGHKLKYSGKYLTTGGQWYDLWGGNFDGFSVWDSQYYWIDREHTTYGNNIETDIEWFGPPPGTRSWGWMYTYKKVQIPNSRLNDTFVMLEFKFNPYRNTRNRDTLQNNMDPSYLKVGLLKANSDPSQIDPPNWYINSFSFTIESTPTSVIETRDDGQGMRYGVGSWSHKLSIQNISYTDTFTSLPGASLKIRLLCDLITKKTYFKIDSTFPDNVVLSDYIDTGFSMYTDELSTYMINVWAAGYGITTPNGKPLEYLIAGYEVGSGTPITLKSYYGTL